MLALLATRPTVMLNSLTVNRMFSCLKLRRTTVERGMAKRISDRSRMEDSTVWAASHSAMVMFIRDISRTVEHVAVAC